MIKMFGKHKYTLGGAYTNKKKAEELVKANRAFGMFSRLEKVPDYSHNPPRYFYRVWQRIKPNK